MPKLVRIPRFKLLPASKPSSESNAIALLKLATRALELLKQMAASQLTSKIGRVTGRRVKPGIYAVIFRAGFETC